MHAIMELDRGIVMGKSTWHGIPSYLVQEDPVSVIEARKILSYPLTKEQTYRLTGIFPQTGERYEKIPGVYFILRTDHNVPFRHAVGERFAVMGNDRLLDFIEANLLKAYPQLIIESVGTLFNGEIAFVNMKLAEFQVKGDKSPTCSNLMYYNPVGMGCYQACAHDVRVVCYNTLRMAAAQGAANRSLQKFCHTANAEQKICDHLVDLAELFLKIEEQHQQLDHLAGQPLNAEQVNAILGHLFEPSDPESDRAVANAAERRTAVMSIFESDQGINGAAKTKYGLLQAVTNWVDHGKPGRNDEASRQWDSLVGDRDAIKQQALELISA